MSIMFSNKISGTWVSANSPVVERLLSFSQLAEGWHYGRGIPATREAIRDALDIRSRLMAMGLKKFEVFPRVDGSVVISAFQENIAVDVTCHGEGLFNILIEDGDDEIFDEENVSLSELLSRMRLIGWREMSRSDCFIPYIIRGIARDLAAPQQAFRVTVSPSSTKRARSGAAAQNAVISHYSTKNTSAVTRQYFSVFDRTNTRTRRSLKILPNQEILAIS